MNPKETLKGIKDPKKITAKIRKGGGGMTAFDAKAVSDADAKAVADYVVKTQDAAGKMTKDLAILIGPDQPWMTTEQSFQAIRLNTTDAKLAPMAASSTTVPAARSPLGTSAASPEAYASSPTVPA